MSDSFDAMTEEEIDEDLRLVHERYRAWIMEFSSDDQGRLNRLRELYFKRQHLVSRAQRMKLVMAELASELSAALKANGRQVGWLKDALAVTREDNSPTVRQEAERPTGAAAQPAADPGSTPGGSDEYEPNGGVTGCWPCNGTGCDRCMPSVEAD